MKAALLFVLLHVGSVSSCKPANCPKNSTCIGKCFYSGRNKQYCFGKCLTESKAECKDIYHRCNIVSYMCHNPNVAKACRKTCNFCKTQDTPQCKGFYCDGSCVPFTYMCDGVRDCKDNNDEHDCRYLSSAWFKSKESRRCGIRTIYRDVATQVSRPFRKIKFTRRKPRLIEGTKAEPNSWPWTGMLISFPLKNVSTFCGVTLVHPEWAITAAHCIINKRKGEGHMAFFGMHDLTLQSLMNPTPTKQARNITETYYFSNYKPDGVYRDIALLKLNESVVLNEYVNIICLPVQYDLVNFHRNGGVTVGWGVTETGKVSPSLLQTLVKPMNKIQCSAEVFRYPGQMIDSSLVCSELDTKNKFGVICDGDSGGPLLARRSTGAYVLVGVGAFGTDVDCAKEGEAAVYTSVYYFLPWIRHYIDKLTFT